MVLQSQTLSPEEQAFYRRHLSLSEIGEEGQKKLKGAKVLIVGVGGLGSPAAFYLAAAGVGTLGIIDFDVVEISNLHRQILHRIDRVGESKIKSATETLHALNPNIEVVGINQLLTIKNAKGIFEAYDIILDGSDNFETRYLINDVCSLLKKPFVHGSLLRFEGQLSLFWPGFGPCYRCLYPEPPPQEAAPSCADAAVLGFLPGVIGVLQAGEVIKWILKKGDPLLGRLLLFDGLKTKLREIQLKRDLHCHYCGDDKKLQTTRAREI